MATVTLGGEPISVGGNFPRVGDSAHSFMLRDFHKQFGVMIMDPPLSGLTARAVVVLNENDKVVWSELVPEIKQEPNYEAALAAAKGEPH